MSHECCDLDLSCETITTLQLTFTLLDFSFLGETPTLPLILHDAGARPVEVDGGVGVVVVVTEELRLAPRESVHAGLQVVVLPDQGLGAGHEAVHDALGQSDVVLLPAAVPPESLAGVQTLRTGPEVLRVGDVSTAPVAVPRASALLGLNGGRFLLHVPRRRWGSGQRSGLDPFIYRGRLQIFVSQSKYFLNISSGGGVCSAATSNKTDQTPPGFIYVF